MNARTLLLLVAFSCLSALGGAFAALALQPATVSSGERAPSEETHLLQRQLESLGRIDERLARLERVTVRGAASAPGGRPGGPPEGASSTRARPASKPTAPFSPDQKPYPRVRYRDVQHLDKWHEDADLRRRYFLAPQESLARRFGVPERVINEGGGEIGWQYRDASGRNRTTLVFLRGQLVDVIYGHY